MGPIFLNLVNILLYLVSMWLKLLQNADIRKKL